MLDHTASIDSLDEQDFKYLLPIFHWCHQEGLQDERLDVLLGQFVAKLQNLKIRFSRINVTLPTLHPQLAAESAEWHEESGTSFFARNLRQVSSDAYRGSPAEAILQRWVDMIEVHLEGGGPLEYEFCQELREQGYTGYLVFGIESHDTQPNMLSFATKQPGGFLVPQVEACKLISDALGPMLAFHRMRNIARNICRTYIGPQTGSRVLNGAIHRGTVEKLNAVVWFCDLRRFTQLSEELGIDGVTHLVNEFFEAVSQGVNEYEGEILKFIGDAALAMFPISHPDDTRRICEEALRAVHRVEIEVARLNETHASTDEPIIDFGVGLNLGEVCYGNVGSSERLDFTVIGSTVNLASRLEGLSANTEHRVLISKSFADAIQSENLASIGVHKLKGVGQPQEVFCRI